MAWLDSDQIERLQRLQQLRETADASTNIPGLGQALATYHQSYPWMSPDAKWSLAAAGVDPSSDTAKTAATAAAHLEVNQGLGFQPVGSPVTRPSGPVDVTSILNGLDQRKAQRANPAPAPTPETVAGPAGVDGEKVVRAIAGDDAWSKLQPDEQARLRGLSFVQGQAPTNASGVDDRTYKVEGDTSDPYVANLLQRVLGPGAVQLWGQWKDQEQDINGKPIPRDTHTYYDPSVTAHENDAYTGPNQITFTGHTHQDSGNPLADIPAAAFEVNGLPALVPALRTGFVAFNAPLQEIQGQVRNIYEAAHGTNPNWLESQSDLGIAAGDLLAGRNVDLGSGVFADPSSQVVQERQRRELERGTIGGQAISLGRFAGNVVFQPGSKPYQLLSGLVDATFALKADPTAFALKQGALAREANSAFAEGSVGAAVRSFHETGTVSDAFRTFQDAGGLAGLRPSISRDAVNTWLTAPEQRPILQALTDTSDPYTVWQRLGRPDPALAVQIADAEHPDQVANLLRDQLGVTIRDKPSLASITGYSRRPFTIPSPNTPEPAVVQATIPNRWTSMMPANHVDATNLQANVVNLERAAALVKAPHEQMTSWFDAMARTQTPTERLAVWEQAMNDTAERLVGKGIAAQRVKTLTSIFPEQQTVERVYAARSIADGQGSIAGNTLIDGKPLSIVDTEPTMLAQTLDGTIPLPDWRALRRSLSAEPLRKILENPLVSGVEHKLLQLQGTVWKALQISTVKTMIKVLGDEQGAIAGRGYDSLLNHPKSALSIILATPLAELPEDAKFLARLRYVTAKELRWGTEHLPGVEPQLTTTALGHDFETLSEIQQVASHGLDTSLDTMGVLHANDWRVLDHTPGVNDEEFTQAYARHLAQHAASPEMQGFARAPDLQAAKDWYWDGGGAKFRQQLANVGREGRPELLDRAGSDAFVQKSMNQMQALTSGNPDLMDAIATGKLADTAIWSTVRDGTPQVSKNFVRDLADYSDDFPRVVPQQKAIYSGDLAGKQLADGIFSRGIHILLGTPSAVLSKSPLFRQAYWERIIDNAPFMTADAQTEVLRVAEQEANLGKGLMSELRKAVTRGSDGTLNLEDADVIAKGHGLDMVRRTTHEFSQRSQAFDMLRLLTPFGEVWRKTIQRWGNIIAENPQVVRRVQQGFQAAQGADLGAFFGQPAGQGFFHTDSNGNEVFSVPGSEWATNALTGVPVPLVGDVKGLSLGTEFFPALGPVASIPVAWTLEKLHAPRDVTETLFPYGPPSNIGDLYNYTPSWFQKIAGHDRPTNPDSVRTFNNTVIDYVRYGVTNGDYDTSTPEGIQHAMEDATSKAHTLYWIRGAAQFFVPGAPSPELLVKDKTGRLVDASILIQEYHDLSNADPNTAGQIFLDKYGPDIFKATTSKSFEYTFGIPTSRESADWVDAHPDVKRDLPHVYGYFAPPSDPEQFDYEVYRNQLEPGQGRAALSPEQWARLANSRLAALQYGKLRDRVLTQNGGKEPDAGQRAWLAQKKQALIDQYPGYADALYGGSGLPARPDPKLLVLEVRKALDNPTVASTDAGQGLKEYLAKRDAVDAQWTAAGFASGSWAQANGADAVAMRDWLRRQGTKITNQHAQFGPLMESVFEREMRDDTDPLGLSTSSSQPAIAPGQLAVGTNPGGN